MCLMVPEGWGQRLGGTTKLVPSKFKTTYLAYRKYIMLVKVGSL